MPATALRFVPPSRHNAASPLAALVERYAKDDGHTVSRWPELAFFRQSQPSAKWPVIYEPSLCVVAQGRKRATFEGTSVTYDPMQFLILALPLPAKTEIIEASAQRPFLSLRLCIDTRTLVELIAEARTPAEAEAAGTRGLRVSRMDPAMESAWVRLLEAIEDQTERSVLAPLVIREILFRVLRSEQGSLLRDVALRDGKTYRIGEVMRYMRAHFDEPLDIARLAGAAAMSPSALHHDFKAVTAMTPMQYLKQIRLHQALALMLDRGAYVAEAAYAVGYGSASQFSREFKRLFGASPRDEVARHRHRETPDDERRRRLTATPR